MMWNTRTNAVPRVGSAGKLRAMQLLCGFWLFGVPVISGIPVFSSPAAPLAGDTIQFRAEKVSSSAAKGREQTSLEGDVYVDVNNSSIEAGQIDIYGEDRDILVAKGHIRVDNHEQNLEIKGQTLFYNRKSKLLRMRRAIDLEDRENEVIVYCDFIEYNEEADIATMQINVRIFSEDIVARSEYAVYDRSTQIVELSGAPIVHKADDIYQASRIFVNLETKDITLDNGVEGQIVTNDAQ